MDTHLVSDEGMLRWFDYSDLTALEMPYSAKFMIEHYLQVGHGTGDIYVGVANEERVIFTRLPEF